VRSGAARHVAAPEPTSTGRCGPKLQLMWQRMDAHPAPCLDLELVCSGTRSSGCRQGPRPERDLATDLYSDSTPIVIKDKSNHWIRFRRLQKSITPLQEVIKA
jgi:hypothetical protein